MIYCWTYWKIVERIGKIGKPDKLILLNMSWEGVLSCLNNLFSKAKLSWVIFSARSGRVEIEGLNSSVKTRIWSGEHCNSPQDQKKYLMFWCTSSGLIFFPECSPSANALNKKLFCLLLNLKEIHTGKAQPLVEKNTTFC